MICSIKPQLASLTRKIACKNHVHPIQYDRYDRFRPIPMAVPFMVAMVIHPIWGNYGLMTIPRCKNATNLDPHMKRSNEVIQLRMMIAAKWVLQKKIGRGFTWWVTTLVTTGLSLFLLLSGVIAHDSWGESLGLMLIWGYREYKTNREKSTKNN